MTEAEEFFYEHGGYSYNPKTETPDEGRRRSAQSLADAEAWAQAEGASYVWEDDWMTENHVREYPDAYDEEPERCEACVMFSADGAVLGSLGCIDDASDDYRRVVEAELADEARYCLNIKAQRQAELQAERYAILRAYATVQVG